MSAKSESKRFYYEDWNKIKPSERYLLIEEEEKIFENFKRASAYALISTYLSGWHYWFLTQYPKSFPNIVNLFAFYGIDKFSDLERLNPRLVRMYESEVGLKTPKLKGSILQELELICNIPVMSPLGEQISDEQYKAILSLRFDNLRKAEKSVNSSSDEGSFFTYINTRVNGLKNQRNIEIIKRRVGLIEGNNPETLDKIGNDMGVTRERVRQIVKKFFIPRYERGYSIYQENITNSLNDAYNNKYGFAIFPEEISNKYEVFHSLHNYGRFFAELIDHHCSNSDSEIFQLKQTKSGKALIVEVTHIEEYKKIAKSSKTKADEFVIERLRGGEERSKKVLSALKEIFPFAGPNFQQAAQTIIRELKQPVNEPKLIFLCKKRMGKPLVGNQTRTFLNAAAREGFWLGTRPTLWGGRNCLQMQDQEISDFCLRVYDYIVGTKGEKYFFDVADRKLEVMNIAKKYENILQYDKYSVLAALSLDPLGRFKVKRLMAWLATNPDPMPKIANLVEAILKKAKKPLPSRVIFEEVRKVRSKGSAQMHESKNVVAGSNGKWLYVGPD